MPERRGFCWIGPTLTPPADSGCASSALPPCLHCLVALTSAVLLRPPSSWLIRNNRLRPASPASLRRHWSVTTGASEALVRGWVTDRINPHGRMK